MKLWKISQTENNDYDTFDSAVVAAETEQQARETHPYGRDEWDHAYPCWASSPDKVAAEYLGEAKPGTPAGVILGSFNAG